jgi:hypothetical protein
MPAKLQPMGYRQTIQEEYAKQKARKAEFSPTSNACRHPKQGVWC